MPKLKELQIEYAIGIRRNLGDFSSAMVEYREREVYDISDLSEPDAILFEQRAYDDLRLKLDRRAEAQDKQWTGETE